MSAPSLSFLALLSLFCKCFAIHQLDISSKQTSIFIFFSCVCQIIMCCSSSEWGINHFGFRWRYRFFSFVIDFRIWPNQILWKIKRKTNLEEKKRIPHKKYVDYRVCAVIYSVLIEYAKSDNSSERPSEVKFFSIVSTVDGKSKTNLHTHTHSKEQN